MINLDILYRLQLTSSGSALSYNQQRLFRGLQPVVFTPGGNVLGGGDAQHVSTREGVCKLPLTFLRWTMQWGVVKCCRYIVSAIVLVRLCLTPLRVPVVVLNPLEVSCKFRYSGSSLSLCVS